MKVAGYYDPQSVDYVCTGCAFKRYGERTGTTLKDWQFPFGYVGHEHMDAVVTKLDLTPLYEAEIEPGDVCYECLEQL